MGRLEIISFAKLPKDNATYSDKNYYVKESARKIEDILNGLGLSKGKDYSMDFTSTPGLDVYIYDKADKNRYLHLYLNANYCDIDLYDKHFEYHFGDKRYLSIYFSSGGRIGIGINDYYYKYFEIFAILSNYFHSIRNFKEEIFKHLEKCYQDGSVNLEEFIRFLLKNINFFEEGKRALDKVKEVLDRNKEKIGGLEMIDFKELVIINTSNTSKVFRNTSKVFLSDYEDYITI